MLVNTDGCEGHTATAEGAGKVHTAAGETYPGQLPPFVKKNYLHMTLHNDVMINNHMKHMKSQSSGTTSSAPPKLAHISRAQKQRYLLEIVFANIISRGNRTVAMYSGM